MNLFNKEEKKLIKKYKTIDLLNNYNKLKTRN